MSEDRFGDLGQAPGARGVGERLEERDRTHPEPVRRPPEVPRPGNKYAWLVGILMLMGLGVLLITTTLPNTGEGLEGPEPGTRVKAFAAPAALSGLEGDANLCQRRPCADQSGPVPACEVRGDDVVNLCRLRRRPLVLTFVFDRGADCYPQVDRSERARRQLPEVEFATVFFTRKKRSEIRELVKARGWVQPVAIDRDGQIANLYGIGGCPTTVFADRGGKVAQSELGNLTEAELMRAARRLR